jgi:DnaJ-class molecular chaperone
MRDTCGTCKGSGVVYPSPYFPNKVETCGTCGGSGDD